VKREKTPDAGSSGGKAAAFFSREEKGKGSTSLAKEDGLPREKGKTRLERGAMASCATGGRKLHPS